MPGSAPAYEQDEGSRQVTFRGSITQRLILLSTLRSDGRPPPRKTRFPAAGPALPDGIGYPQGFNERFHIEMILLSRASWRKIRRPSTSYVKLVRLPIGSICAVSLFTLSCSVVVICPKGSFTWSNWLLASYA